MQSLQDTYRGPSRFDPAGVAALLDIGRKYGLSLRPLPIRLDTAEKLLVPARERSRNRAIIYLDWKCTSSMGAIGHTSNSDASILAVLGSIGRYV